MSKPRVVVLGGLGFIGRNLVQYLVANELASYVRVVDKRGIIASFLPADVEALLDEGGIAEYLQADLSDEESANEAVGDEIDVVFNCAAETKSGQAGDRYASNTISVAKNVCSACASAGVKRLVHFSTATVYKPSSKPCDESAALKPWTQPATASLEAEKIVAAAKGVARVILRPAVVYGPGDENGLMPRFVCATSYKWEDAKMDFMWDGKLKVSTVHVFDVVRAAWLAAAKASVEADGDAAVYNLADAGDTDQSKIAEIVTAVTGVETGFVGSMTSRLASTMGMAASEANKRHLGPWMKVLKENDIMATSLTPYIHEELLQNNNLCISGQKITEELGFKYKVPAISAPAAKDMVQKAVAQGIFPSKVNGTDLGLAPSSSPSAAAGGGGTA